MTLMMRPSVSSPTGTEIGAPVSVHSWPRTRPSEVSIATVRTVFSPRCCATSSTRRLPPFVVSSAFRIAGR